MPGKNGIDGSPGVQGRTGPVGNPGKGEEGSAGLYVLHSFEREYAALVQLLFFPDWKTNGA